MAQKWRLLTGWKPQHAVSGRRFSENTVILESGERLMTVPDGIVAFAFMTDEILMLANPFFGLESYTAFLAIFLHSFGAH
jgi:hypothetical protein